MPHAFDRPVDYPGRPAPLRTLAAAVLTLSLGVAAGGAAAQPANRPAATQAQSPAGQKPAAAQPAGSPVDSRLAEIKKQLNITAAQQPQFEQFASVVKQNAQSMETLMQKAEQSSQPNAVEGLRTAANFAETEAENLKRLVPALESLYGTLSDQQKRAADRLFNAPPPSGPPPQTPRRRG